MLTPKKSLGQHFLRSPKALKDIIESSNLSENDVVLEIGPGEGVLTEKLLETGAHIIAVEKDDRAYELLLEKFEAEIKEKRIKLIHGDILEHNTADLVEGKFQVIANIPYYITGILIRKLLTEEPRPIAMTLLVQKEVAERIVAKDEKESLLSLSVKAYGNPRIISTVKKGSFTPPPKVDSAIIRIERINSHKAGEYEENFWKIIKKAFNTKRKTLFGSIKEFFIDPEKVFNVCNIEKNARPETIPLEKWIILSKEVMSS